MFNGNRFLALRLSFSLVALSFLNAVAYGQAARTEPVVFAPPSLSVNADPLVVTTCAGDANQAVVHLSAKGTSTQGNPTHYDWQANAGKISGDGNTVAWDLAGLSPGYYKVFLNVKSGVENEECEAFSSTTVLVNCIPQPPVCPNVSIVCPEPVGVDQPITFTAAIVGASEGVPANYSWSISGGRIIEGQGTPSITVDTKGLAGQTIQAHFSVNGYSADCSASCAVQLPSRPTCKKFDEFPSIQRNDEKARLDNFAVELQRDPKVTGYVVVSPGSQNTTNDVSKRSSRIMDYLINTRGLESGRIITRSGPGRAELRIELWTCPQGAAFPPF